MATCGAHWANRGHPKGSTSMCELVRFTGDKNAISTPKRSACCRLYLCGKPWNIVMGWFAMGSLGWQYVRAGVLLKHLNALLTTGLALVAPHCVQATKTSNLRARITTKDPLAVFLNSLL